MVCEFCMILNNRDCHRCRPFKNYCQPSYVSSGSSGSYTVTRAPEKKSFEQIVKNTDTSSKNGGLSADKKSIAKEEKGQEKKNDKCCVM